MVLKHNSITERLKELDTVLQELNLYTSLSEEEIRTDLSHRWIIERGLIAAASLILDIADHVLVGQFGLHTATYEDSLLGLQDKQVITDELYQQLKGLGGFRNVLVHLYQEIDPYQVWDNYHKGIGVFPKFAQEILYWLSNQAP